MLTDLSNIDKKTVAGFGEEWSRFDQELISQSDLLSIFSSYFDMVDWSRLSHAVAADIGCGSGRWAKLVAERVQFLHLIDASDAALQISRKKLAKTLNVEFHCASVAQLPFPEQSLDFAYSLGVLHHVPDTQAALVSIAKVLKPGAIFLIYLYYSFDNRPAWFQRLWKVTETARWSISRCPKALKHFACDLIATLIYWPLARIAKLLNKLGVLPTEWPLSAYQDKGFYVMRTDALDRFGTPLEKRFSKLEIEKMLIRAGFNDVSFSSTAPYWIALATR